MGLRGRAALPRGGHAQAARVHHRPARLRIHRTRATRAALRGVTAAPAAEPARVDRGICRSDDYDRALHSYGRSYRDIVRAFRGRFDHPPDVVAHPRDEDEVRAVLDWAVSAGAAVIPFGGGTSVVGGRRAPRSATHAGVVTIDLKALDRVLEVDPVSLSARIQAGATGPELEEQLAEHGLTLRHFPQSFQFSTLGGWIATRAGGHFATLLHAHRRPRRVGARADPGGRLGVATAAGLRRRRLARPDAARIRGHARGDHRGVDARAAATEPAGVGGRRVRRLRDGRRRPCARCRSRGCIRPTAD